MYIIISLEPKITDFGLSKTTPTHQRSSTISKVSSNCNRLKGVWPSNHNVQGTMKEQLTEDVINTEEEGVVNNKKGEGVVNMEEESVVDRKEEGVVSNKAEGMINIEEEVVIDIEEGVVNAIMQDEATTTTNKLPFDRDQQIIYDTVRCKTAPRQPQVDT